jgi:hypothetical protein
MTRPARLRRSAATAFRAATLLLALATSITYGGGGDFPILR